ncbi:MAG: hypothetical protein K2H76_06605 [Muribaculaceae bacterium]|nr:hypothetical protein [Muribaculaceae bacterium]
MNNQIFESARFAAYFKKSVVERKKSLLISIGLLILLPLAFCLGMPYIKGYYESGIVETFVVRGNVPDPMWAPELTFFLIMWLIAATFCGDFYSPLSKKESRISLFTCPASNFEKFLTYFLIFVICLPVIGFLGYLFADALRVWVYRGIKEGVSCIHYISPRYLLSFGCASEYLTTDLYDYAAVSPEEKEALINFMRTAMAVKFSMCLFGGLLLQSIFALGSSVWPNNSGRKTAFFVIGFGMLSSILFAWGAKTFFPHTLFEPRNFGIESETAQIVISDIIVFCIIIFTWIVSYMRFKEWEVIKRW